MTEARHPTLKSPTSVLSEALDRPLGRVLNAAGLLGLAWGIGSAIALLDRDKDNKLLGFEIESVKWMTFLVMVIIFGSVFGWFLWNRVRLAWKENDAHTAELLVEQNTSHSRERNSLQREIDSLRSQLTDFAHRSLDRFWQQSSFSAMSNVYGFKVVKWKAGFVIYAQAAASDHLRGECKCSYEITLEATRELRHWSTHALSSADPGKSCEISLHSNNRRFTDPKPEEVEVRPGVRVERLVFEEPLHPADGQVVLRYSRSLPPGCFRTAWQGTDRSPNGQPLPCFEYVSHETSTPVEQLELTVQFHDHKPAKNSCVAEARWGRAGLPLVEEESHARAALDYRITDGFPTAKLCLKFPVMGARYFIKWDLEQKP